MNLIRRFRNLWKLSEFEIPEIGEKPEVGTLIGALWKKKEMASIIRLKDPLDKIIKQ
jgi:hypothetical protein